MKLTTRGLSRRQTLVGQTIDMEEAEDDDYDEDDNIELTIGLMMQITMTELRLHATTA